MEGTHNFVGTPDGGDAGAATDVVELRRRSCSYRYTYITYDAGGGCGGGVAGCVELEPRCQT